MTEPDKYLDLAQANIQRALADLNGAIGVYYKGGYRVEIWVAYEGGSGYNVVKASVMRRVTGRETDA